MAPNGSSSQPPTTRTGARHPLDRRRRTASRIALYGSLALAGAMAGLLLLLTSRPLAKEQKADTWDDIDFPGLEEVRLLAEYVRIDTSAATGSSLEGARFLADQLAASGLEPELEILSEKEANVWAVLEGEEPGAIVLHNHIDVENIHRPDEWDHPPFSAFIEPPWIYGRGVFDMKSVAIAQLLAIKSLAESGVRPKKSIIFLATTDEETGSDLGTRWILDQHPELTERFELVLTEGGVLEGRDRENIKYWGTEFGQKRYVHIAVCSASRQQLEAIWDDVRDLGRSSRRLSLSDDVARFLPIYAPTRDREDYRQLMADPERIVRDPQAFASLPPYVQAMFRDELHLLGIVDEGGSYTLHLKLHLLPGADLETARRELLPEWLFFGTSMTLYKEPTADHGSPLDHPVLDLIADALHETYPDATVGPMFLPWTATDSRFFRARGIPSYGFSPFTILTTDALQVSGPNERIALPGYVEGVAIYRRLVERLATETLADDG